MMQLFHEINVMGMNTPNVYADMITHDLVYMDSKLREFARKYGFYTNHNNTIYKVNDGYLRVKNLTDMEKVSEFPVKGEKLLLRDLKDLDRDIMVLICSCNNISEESIKETWGRVNTLIQQLTDNEVALGDINTILSEQVSVPKNKVITKKELQKYEMEFRFYKLVDNIRTSFSYTYEGNSWEDYCYRKLVGDEYKLEGESVVFQDGSSYPAYMALPRVDSSLEGGLGALHTAYSLSGEHGEFLYYNIEHLNVGDVRKNAWKRKQTYLHGSEFIQMHSVSIQNYSELKEKDCDVFLDNTTFKILCELPNAESCNKFRQTSGYTQNEQDYSYICGMDTIDCMGVTHVEITPKGYDIRVLIACRTNNKLAYYEIPLVCCGLCAVHFKGAYRYRLTFQNLIISDTVFNNLVCAGNGKLLHRVI